MTEKLTVSRIGLEKTINFVSKKTGEPDSFKKVGFQTNEHGSERWFDITYRDSVPVKVGEAYEFEISEREYNGKTYYDAKLPKNYARGGGVSDVQLAQLSAKLDTIITEVRMLRGKLDKTPDPSKTYSSSVESVYPEEEINPADIPF